MTNVIIPLQKVMISSQFRVFVDRLADPARATVRKIFEGSSHSFPRASLTENCSLLGTDNVRGQISVHIFAPNGDYCLYIPKEEVH